MKLPTFGTVEEYPQNTDILGCSRGVCYMTYIMHRYGHPARLIGRPYEASVVPVDMDERA